MDTPKDFILFFIAVSFFGFSQSIIDSTFNNFLSETYSLSSMNRTLLELPRELPGFFVIFVSAILFFLCARRLAVVANLLMASGLFLIAFFSKTFNMMVIWLFILSIGQHLFIPVNQSIGMELAKEGHTGRRLGQLNSVINIFAILGSFAIFLGFRFLHFNFKISFLIGAVGFFSASIMISFMKPDKSYSIKDKFVFRKEYSMYYLLVVLFGTRKQIFLTFAPWVLVTIFNQKTQVVATLLTIGGIIGIFFKPMLGRAIDKLGERIILASEAFILIFVCIGYGFSRFIFPAQIALYVAFGCYIADQLLMSFGMARATYLKKIAVTPQDVAQTLTMGTSIDHIFSISIALFSGLIWNILGYQYVFLIGAIIALINLFVTLQLKVKKA